MKITAVTIALVHSCQAIALTQSVTVERLPQTPIQAPAPTFMQPMDFGSMFQNDLFGEGTTLFPTIMPDITMPPMLTPQPLPDRPI